jgi:hypothetical protein
MQNGLGTFPHTTGISEHPLKTGTFVYRGGKRKSFSCHGQQGIRSVNAINTRENECPLPTPVIHHRENR